MAQPGIGGAAPASGIRLLVSDVDGTLVRPDKQISSATIAAIRALRGAGVAFTLVSSRPPRGMRTLVRMLELDTPTAAFNGGAIVDADGHVIESHPLSSSNARVALDLFARAPVETWVFADDQWLLRDPHGPYVPLERHTLGFDGTLVTSFEPYLDRIGKIVAASADAAGLVRLEQELNPRIAPDAHASRSQVYYLDVNHARANKGDAVAALARHLGIPLAETAVIGDGDNDVPMFERAGFSIAMGQASAQVRARATVTTAGNADDGLAAAVHRFILPGT
ncbi:hydrolase [Bordetella sp. H567]|uniref:Cof-type HAD-IIB family hydrolase n=1 Tax=Bordetella sp. H567 TaxID=1697043 RepID=UPI00081CFEA0|nr:Cof-type HAD-IIB family hydrolase [Bordetella sp. H567]AOB32534.1 hydrolase [Bordetella sp. H567]